MAELALVVARLNLLLDVAATPDYGPALNGLQFANTGSVRRVAAAVDYSARTAGEAAAIGADFLLVHHGMFWAGLQPVVGARHEAVRTLVQHDIALYSAHLPIDRHPDVGNNVLLARTLELTPSRGFGRYQAIDVGVAGDDDVPTSLLVQRATAFAATHGGTVRTTAVAEGRRTNRWAILTGAGASSETLREAQNAGVDTLIVGEGPHHTAVEAADQGMVVIYAGHYASETLGVQAVASLISDEFGIPWSFIPSPTGL